MSHKYPIVLVPGLFGSWGEGIINNKGSLYFGPADYIYEPLIEYLEHNGYETDYNLKVAFYNWRLSIKVITRNYLIPTINKIKNNLNVSKVNLICHSMGGLVARDYIQSEYYQQDIENLIMIGTPNSGSPTAYYFWGGGEIPYKNINDNIFYKLIWKSYTWYLKKLYKGNKLNNLRKHFPAVKDLLPSKKFYGNYLFTEARFKRKLFIPNETLQSQNEFLNTLNDEINVLYNRVPNIHQIIGYGYSTNNQICVDTINKGKWEDGKPLYSLKTKLGDGTVTIDSSNISDSKKYYIKKNHSEIVKFSDEIIGNILDIKSYNKTLSNDKDILVSILITNIKEIKVEIDGNLINKNELKGSNSIYNIDLEKDNMWIIIRRKKIDNLKIYVAPKDKVKSEALILTNKRKKSIKTTQEVGIGYKGWIKIF